MIILFMHFSKFITWMNQMILAMFAVLWSGVILYCTVWLIVVYSPLRKLLITHASPLPMKGCQFGSLLGVHGHREVRISQRVTPILVWGIRACLRPSLSIHDFHAICQAFGNGSVITCFTELSQDLYQPDFNSQLSACDAHQPMRMLYLNCATELARNM